MPLSMYMQNVGRIQMFYKVDMICLIQTECDLDDSDNLDDLTMFQP